MNMERDGVSKSVAFRRSGLIVALVPPPLAELSFASSSVSAIRCAGRILRDRRVSERLAIHELALL